MNDDLAGIGDVRVIDERGEMLDVMPVERALELAGDRGLDLVEVDAEKQPPVCKFIGIGKFKYPRRR